MEDAKKELGWKIPVGSISAERIDLSLSDGNTGASAARLQSGDPVTHSCIVFWVDGGVYLSR